MFKCFGALVAASLVLMLSAVRGGAIEPDAPEALIGQDEAIVIAVRQRLDRRSVGRNRGDAADKRALAAYYATQTSKPLWVDDNGLNARARKLIREIGKAAVWGLDATAFDLPSPARAAASTSGRIDAEMRMSIAVLKYARHARGGRMNPKDLSLAIDRTPPVEKPQVVLTKLKTVDDPAGYLRGLHPSHVQFERLRTAYLKTLRAERDGTASDLVREPRSKRRKSRRKKRRQASTRLSKRLLYNMEMWRWMPLDLGRKYVQANIPEYKVRVVRNDRIVHEERIVTGKVKNMTPMFSDELETVVFHPFWGVPNSIKVKEILPSLVRGGNILKRQNLRIQYGGRDIDPYSVDWSRTDIRNYHVYQPPGRRNALGVVKFMFPNKHAVYMHDTPSKHLFRRKHRAYSHGCVRVRNPLKLAEVVLSHDKGWDRSRIDSLIKRGPNNNQIALNAKIPVHVTYFTAHVASSGKVVLFNDVYGHEKLIQMGLDGKAHLIVKEKPDLNVARRRVVSRTNVGYSRPSRDLSWRRAIWGQD